MHRSQRRFNWLFCVSSNALPQPAVSVSTTQWAICTAQINSTTFSIRSCIPWELAAHKSYWNPNGRICILALRPQRLKYNICYKKGHRYMMDDEVHLRPPSPGYLPTPCLSEANSIYRSNLLLKLMTVAYRRHKSCPNTPPGTGKASRSGNEFFVLVKCLCICTVSCICWRRPAVLIHVGLLVPCHQSTALCPCAELLSDFANGSFRRPSPIASCHSAAIPILCSIAWLSIMEWSRFEGQCVYAVTAGRNSRTVFFIFAVDSWQYA